MAANVFKFNNVIRLAKLASDPSSPENGYLYYNTTDNVIRKYENSSWGNISGDEIADNIFKLFDSDKTTAKASFDLAAVTAGQERVITVPDANVDLGGIATNASDLSDHEGAASGAHAASAVSNTPSGNLAATDVQAALNELQGDIDTNATNLSDHEGEASGAHAASAISNTPSGNLAASDVQAALNELQTDVDTRATTSYVDTAVDNALAGLDFQEDVLDIQIDATLDPGASPTTGDRYLITDSGNLHANFGSISGVGDDDIVEYSGSAFVVAYDVSVQGEGALVWDRDGNTWQRYDGTDWAEFGGLSGVTAGAGLTSSGNVMSIHLGASNPALEFDVGGDNGRIQVKVDGTTMTRGASGLSVGTIGDSNISAGVDAAKIADGSVSNTEFQYLDGVTSGIQGQIDGKIATVSADSSPSLGGDLTLGNANVLIEGTSGMLRGDATNFLEEDYIHGETLLASQSGTALTALGFAHASYEGIEVTYKIKEATTNRVRIGRFSITTNGTDVSVSDTFNETADCGVSWDAAVNGANIDVKYTTTANNKTMHCDVKRIKA